jgi:hypothetical protein
VPGMTQELDLARRLVSGEAGSVSDGVAKHTNDGNLPPPGYIKLRYYISIFYTLVYTIYIYKIDDQLSAKARRGGRVFLFPTALIIQGGP